MLLLLSMSVSADDDREAVGNVLDALHTNASNADFDSYFGLYDDNAVFIGTDASEVWSLTTFMAYAKPHFDKGSGWTYTPRDRHIYFSPDKKVAWFDELLDNENLSIVSGSVYILDHPKYRQQEGNYSHYPFRFWAGNRLLGGYSDHLAIRVEIIKM